MVFEETPEKKSLYNSGLAQIYRMDELTKEVHKKAILGSYIAWNEYLDRLWAELMGDTKNEDAEKIKSFDDKLRKLGFWVNPNIESFTTPPRIYYILRFHQKQVLMEKERFIRQLQNDLGKGTAYADPESDLM